MSDDPGQAVRPITDAQRRPACVIPADRRRYPPGCPDPDWCRGNRLCYWFCNDWKDHDDYAREAARADP